jgi:hypothetical protein
MLLAEAKSFVGKICTVRFTDRNGAELTIVSKIYDATYVPLYGGYLVTDTDDIRLDRICGVSQANELKETIAQECVAA